MASRKDEVLVALSGGLDSAAVVLFLREAGYRPRALFLDMLGSADARQRAIDTARTLDVELTIEPCADLFRIEIIDYLLAEHAAGRTPAPCSRCNPRIKWRLLADAADRFGIHYLATGHYVRTTTYGGHSYFRRGADPAKDQSYYLWDVPEPLIRRALTPLGDYTKTEVRRILQQRYGLTELAGRRESMGVCFLGDLSYAEFLRSRLPLQPGEVVLQSGEVVGEHDGFPLYTAGQKRGFQLFGTAPHSEASVTGVDAARNRIVVGPDEALYSRTLLLKEWRTASLHELQERADEVRIMVRGIGRNPAGGCRLFTEPAGRLRVTLLEERAWAAMPGQPVVFYLDDRVVGGGVLDEALPQ